MGLVPIIFRADPQGGCLLRDIGSFSPKASDPFRGHFPQLAVVRGNSPQAIHVEFGRHSWFPSLRAINKCESLAKELYSMMGLQYRESSSEDEAPAATEVIEIADEEDDDVMSVDSGWKQSSVSPAMPGEGWG